MAPVDDRGPLDDVHRGRADDVTDDLLAPAVQQFSPRPAELVVAGLAGVALGAAAVALSEPAGQVLVGVAALGLLAVALVGALRRPRVAVDADELVVRGPLRTVRVPWTEVGDVLLRTQRRLGLRSETVEVSGAGDSELFLLLTRRDLGRDPAEVHRALSRLHLAALRRTRGGSPPA